MSELLNPPAIPSAILDFFASQPDFSALAGDISEEFHQRAQSSGARAAKRWFWREAVRNAFALAWRELRQTPVRTTLLALGCDVTVNIAVILFMAMRREVLHIRQPVGEIFLGFEFLAALAAGSIGSSILRGREWALALTFTSIWAWQWRNLFAGGGVHFPVLGFPVMQFAVLQFSFWLGCLSIRQFRFPSNGASQHA